MMQVWYHEVCRTFSDKLNSDSDKALFHEAFLNVCQTCGELCTMTLQSVPSILMYLPRPLQ